MATAKKPAPKKPASKSTSKAAAVKKAPVKKTTVKKAVAKKPVAKKSPVKKAAAKKTTAKAASVRSFRVATAERPFTDFRITKQTVYWVILVAFIVFAQLWILNLHVEVASLIEAQQEQLQEF